MSAHALRECRVAMSRTLLRGVALAGAVAAMAAQANAETVRVGVARLGTSAQFAIADAKGYFKAEGLEPQFTFFDAQQPIAIGVASGDLDFGNAAQTAALYSLAGQGNLRVIGGGSIEAPTFHYLAFMASNQAYAAGLTSFAKLGGHSFALTQMGTGLQYSLGQSSEKWGFDLKTVQLMPLQSNSNIASALAGGRTDSAIFSATGALPLTKKGDAKLLGWVGDELPRTQANLLFTSTKIANERHDTVVKFMAAVRHGTEDYFDAFADRDGKRADQPSADATLAILANFLHQPVELVKEGLPYLDREARLEIPSVKMEIAWYRAQGLLKSDVDADIIIDKRYAVSVPGS